MADDSDIYRDLAQIDDPEERTRFAREFGLDHPPKWFNNLIDQTAGPNSTWYAISASFEKRADPDSSPRPEDDT